VSVGFAVSADRRAERRSPAEMARQLFRLRSDLRLDLFAIVFALGTIHHEVQFLLEQQITGSLFNYLERSALVRPTVGWPSSLAVGLHVADIVVSLLILVLPYRRALLCLLALTFLPSQLVSPERTPSHNSMMIFSLAIILDFGLAEIAERIRSGRWASEHGTDWLRWTSTGLLWMCALTYFFAGFHKLNERFFSPDASPVLAFVLPYATLLGISRGTAVAYFGYPMIILTVVAELALPFLLLWSRTRLFGALLGVLFHLVMMGQGVMDFPVLILAFYPLFLTIPEARQLLAKCLSRPPLLQLILLIVITGLGVAAIRGASQVRLLYTPDPTSGLAFLHAVLSYATFLLFVHLALTLTRLLFNRPRQVKPVLLPG
jgi:hypothetical protein